MLGQIEVELFIDVEEQDNIDRLVRLMSVWGETCKAIFIEGSKEHEQFKELMKENL